MKTFKHYLAEAVKEIPVRIKLATEVSDAIADNIEAEMQRYDVVSFSNPQKTIMQEHPLDFGTKIRNREVYIIDAVVRMPVSFETLRRNLSDKTGIPLELEQEAEIKRNTADQEDYEPRVGQEYTPEEAGDDKGENFGEKHKENFLKTLQDNREKDPERAEVEVEGPLSVKAKTDTAKADTKAVEDSATKSPLSKDNRKPMKK
jgi:hypothetical protein